MSSFKLELIENKAYIAGKFIETRESFEVKNPYTMKTFSAVGNCYMKEAEQALQAADRDFQDWKKTTPKQRAEKLRSWASLVRENAEAIASLLTKEQGKAYGEALGEVMQGAVMIDWFSEEPEGSTVRLSADVAIKSETLHLGHPLVLSLLSLLGIFHSLLL